jgi:hypothetical protein
MTESVKKYREGKVKRTMNVELKESETGYLQAVETKSFVTTYLLYNGSAS